MSGGAFLAKISGEKERKVEINGCKQPFIAIFCQALFDGYGGNNLIQSLSKDEFLKYEGNAHGCVWH